MSEPARLADQIRRAFDGEAWHGDSLLKLLSGVDAKTAAKHPIKGAHSIWELVLHIAAWDGAALRRSQGKTAKLTSLQNFPPVKDTSTAAWQQALSDLKSTHSALIDAVATFPESRLFDQVPGKKAKHQTMFYLFSGIVQHELYHAGQIALLKKFR